jgi:hypothetical protein
LRNVPISVLPCFLHLAVLEFSQVELCEVVKSHGDVNNWILTGALRPADAGKPQSSQALFPWQFSSPPARLRHQASLQPRRQRALRLIGYIELNIVHLIKCNEWPVGLPSEHLFNVCGFGRSDRFQVSRTVCSLRVGATTAD